jgi:Phage ABA sandwich domain
VKIETSMLRSYACSASGPRNRSHDPPRAVRHGPAVSLAMTVEELGRLDIQIAEKVMGWHRVENGWIDSAGEAQVDVEYVLHDDEPWSPSIDIGDAWQVAERFDEVDLHKGPHGWLCRMERGTDDGVQHGEALRAETAQLAICRAALKAVDDRPA